MGRGPRATATAPRAPGRQAIAAGEPVLLEIDLQGARLVRAVDARGAAGLPRAAELGRTGPPARRPRHRVARGATGRGWPRREVELAAESEFDETLVNTSVEDVARELLALMDVG